MVNLKQHTRVLVSKPNRRKFDILDKLEGNNNNMQLWIEKLKKNTDNLKQKFTQYW